MAVYQANRHVEITVGYSRYRLLEGQLVAIDENNKQLYGYIKNHPNFNEIRDDRLIKLAPPIDRVMVPGDPFMMRKEDIIMELRSYGISVDPYMFEDQLSMQLRIARKMLKRNFITVLNERGIPVYLDRLKLPVPVVTQQDNNLREPPDVTLEDIQKFKEEHEDKEPVTQNKKLEDEKDVVVAIEKSIDPFMEINKGKSYEQFLEDITQTKERIDPEIERISKPIRFEDDPPTEFDDFEFENMNQFKYLLEIKDRSFMVNGDHITEEQLNEEIKWSKVSIDIYEPWLRYYGICPEVNEEGVKKRWIITETAREFYENNIKKKKMRAELNALKLRYDEICKHEPNFKTFKKFAIKRRITELGRYGMNVSYSNDTNDNELRRYGKKVYTLCKLGLQAPDTKEELDAKILKYNRTNILQNYK